MPDEQQTQQEPYVIEVRNSENAISVEDMQYYIEQTAERAAKDALEGATDQISTNTQLVAQDTGDNIAAQVVAHIDETRAEDASKAVNATEMVLSDSQWTFMQDSMRIQSACSVLTLCMVCACFGAIVVRFFVDGWRR